MKTTTFVARIFVTVVLFFFAFLVPWWIFILAIFTTFFLFPRYIEGVLLAVLFDLWYGLSPNQGFSFADVFMQSFFFSTIALCGWYLVELVKERLLVYHHG